ncbi:RDD family protein [Cellulomonas sp.]|uniref:RDD family protein n=1 Tax=Cellulomonas sp. TaxID=40001 RepID=UPI001B0A5B46|nr:RDD family protein [Cellulomonas sp.]MBO9555515.1 RDD family protein [Cellulomonas sp.]
MDGVVIGEGVLLDSQPASPISRVLAALLDLVVLGAGLFALVFVAGISGVLDSEDGSAIFGIVIIATITVIVPTTVETLTRGRSVGKLAVGIRVVRDDGGPVVLRQAFVRALVGVVELWMTLGSVALIASIVHPQGKRLGDMLAGTYALRVRGATKMRTAAPMPPWLAGWAARADIARLPDGLALSVRQFLVRAAKLHPASRVQLGEQLTAEVQRYVHPLPPPGTHPEAFLTAVLAERRERELRTRLTAAHRDALEADLLHRLPYGVPDPAQ